MWAIEMHPDERPQSLQQFAATLFGRSARPVREGESAQPDGWRVALSANRTLVLTALGLFILAIVLTLF